jgi:hypothetical protein
MDHDNQPAIVHDGVTKVGECNYLIGDNPPVQFEPCDKLEQDCAAVLVGVNKSSGN